MARVKKRKNLSQGWLMTFTDMLMLLVVMFVLFLSFSEVDSDSFKQNAGPIAEAFNQPPPTSILTGQSAIIDISETNVDFDTIGKNVGFDESNTNPVDENVDRSIDEPNTSITAKSIDLDEDQNVKGNGKLNQDNDEVLETQDNDYSVSKNIYDEVDGLQSQEPENNLSRNIEALMQEEINAGKFQVVTTQNIVTLRFPEKVTFASGDASLRADIQPILDQISKIISTVGDHNKIIVTGHTDSIPISNYKYRSNWDLSAARAVSVVHRILKNKNIDKSRLVAIGSADVNPIANNNTSANRALNRRVEIRIETSNL